jgi:hypothetical protein
MACAGIRFRLSRYSCWDTRTEPFSCHAARFSSKQPVSLTPAHEPSPSLPTRLLSLEQDAPVLAEQRADECAGGGMGEIVVMNDGEMAKKR